jgi:signal peptidase I
VYESQINARSFRFSTGSRAFDMFAGRVPEKHIYVLGDHRDHSNDSRNPAVGMIPLTAIKGRALFIYWSSGEDGARWDRAFHRVQ